MPKVFDKVIIHKGMFYVITLENRHMYHYYKIDNLEEVMDVINHCLVDPSGDCEVLDAFGFIFTERETHNKPTSIMITGPFTKKMTDDIQKRIRPDI